MGFKLFSKKKAAPVVPCNRIESFETIMKIRQNIENQEKREALLVGRMQKLADEAKVKMAKGDKKGAIFAMKKRKLHETELAKIDNVKMTLETQAISLEGAASNVDTYNVMQTGSTTMKSIRKAFGIDKVDQMFDNMKDEMELHQEVNHAFTQPIDPTFADDDELLAELNALEKEGSNAAAAFSWPTMSSTKPTSPQPVKASSQTKEKKSRLALFEWETVERNAKEGRWRFCKELQYNPANSKKTI